VKLPKLKEPLTGVTYDSILIVYNRLIKYSYFKLYLKLSTTEDLAYEFLRTVFANYRMLEEVVSDRDKLFTSKF